MSTGTEKEVLNGQNDLSSEALKGFFFNVVNY